jgi:hypothetical protein
MPEINDKNKGNVRIGDIDLGEFPLLLAPMEDVSDPPFRKLCKEQGADMVYTEFISADGLVHDAMNSLKTRDFRLRTPDWYPVLRWPGRKVWSKPPK